LLRVSVVVVFAALNQAHFAPTSVRGTLSSEASRGEGIKVLTKEENPQHRQIKFSEQGSIEQPWRWQCGGQGEQALS
jgi:hypothetical protein